MLEFPEELPPPVARQEWRKLREAAREKRNNLAPMFATRLAGTAGQTVLASDRQYLVGERGELRRLGKPDRSKKARRRARAAREEGE